MGSSLEEALEVMGVVGSVTVTSTGNATHLKCTGENVTVVFDTFLGDAPALAFSWGGLAGAARNRTGCDLRTVDRARVAQLANPYDPVFVDGDAPGARVGGAC